MAGIRMFEDQLRVMCPHTYNALQKLVLAMADIARNAGKKTFFGRDKGQEAYSKFLATLKATVQAMVLDELIREATSTEDVLVVLEEKFRKFSLAFPHWQDAYGFSAVFFGQGRTDAIATIERLRSMP